MSPAAGSSAWEHETFAYSRLHARLSIIARHVAALRPADLLELGCGIGVLRQAVLADTDPRVDYWGCDISQSAVETIGDPQVVACDLNRQGIPFAGRSFDCIVGSGVLEYIDDLPALITQLASRLVPDGHLVVSYFNMRHIYRRVQRLAGREPYRHRDWRNDQSPAGFSAMLESAGFEVLERAAVSLGLRPPPAAVEQPAVAAPRPYGRLLLGSFAHTIVYLARRRGNGTR